MLYESISPDDTARAGDALGRVARAGLVVGLIGDLGAGKTLFVQGLARGLEVPANTRVVSPTFTLVNEYPGGRLALSHADLYRLDERAELDEIGLDEAMRGDGVVAVEWCDRFEALPADALLVRLEVVGDEARRIQATAGGPVSQASLAAWAGLLEVDA